MTIRTFTESDGEVLKEITIACFDRGCSIDYRIEDLFGLIDRKDWEWRKRRDIDGEIAANPAGIFVAEVEGCPIGYVTTHVDRATMMGSIPNLAVLPEHRRKGIARGLINHAVAYLKGEGMRYVRIQTLETNESGRHVYPACGFREIARQIHYIMPVDGPPPPDQTRSS